MFMSVLAYHLKIRAGCNLFFKLDTAEYYRDPEKFRYAGFDCVGLPRASDADQIEAWLKLIYSDLARELDIVIEAGDPLTAWLRDAPVRHFLYHPDGKVEATEAPQ